MILYNLLVVNILYYFLTMWAKLESV